LSRTGHIGGYYMLVDTVALVVNYLNHIYKVRIGAEGVVLRK
jgi:hypothetical protein